MFRCLLSDVEGRTHVHKVVFVMQCAACGQNHKEIYLQDELLRRHTRDGDRTFNNRSDDVSDCSVDSHRYHLLQVQPLRQVLEVGID